MTSTAAYQREWYRKNREKVLEWNKKYREAHPEITQKCRRNWQARHPEKKNEQRRQNYARGRRHNYRTRQPWTWREDVLIMLHRQIPDRRLAKMIERSVQAIQIRRCKLKAEA